TISTAINLAVLPFTATGSGNDKQFFSQGLTETVNAQLSSLSVNRRFQVATLNEIRSRKVTNINEAREQVGANTVLTGSLEYFANIVRITCLLIDTKTGRTLQKKVFDSDASNPIAVQDGVVEAAIGMMGFSLRPEERTVLAGLGTKQPG